MAHELTPRPDRPPLPSDKIIRRLQDSFAGVELDMERASRELEESLLYMARVGGPHYGKKDIDRTRRSIGRSVYVTLADETHSDLAYLSFILEPEHEKIFISYESSRHEEESRKLRERLARVLDYEMELV